MALPPSASLDNRRTAFRKPTRCLAYVQVPGSRRDIECVILDISASGARLKLSGGPAKPFQQGPTIPAAFRLYVHVDNTEIDCEVTWRKTDSIGVRFLSGFRPAGQNR